MPETQPPTHHFSDDLKVTPWLAKLETTPGSTVSKWVIYQGQDMILSGNSSAETQAVAENHNRALDDLLQQFEYLCRRGGMWTARPTPHLNPEQIVWEVFEVDSKTYEERIVMPSLSRMAAEKIAKEHNRSVLRMTAEIGELQRGQAKPADGGRKIEPDEASGMPAPDAAQIAKEVRAFAEGLGAKLRAVIEGPMPVVDENAAKKRAEDLIARITGLVPKPSDPLADVSRLCSHGYVICAPCGFIPPSWTP